MSNYKERPVGEHLGDSPICYQVSRLIQQDQTFPALKIGAVTPCDFESGRARRLLTCF